MGATLNAHHIIQDALTFVRNGSTLPVLLLESNLNNIPLGDHTDSEADIIASGYTSGASAGNHYVKGNATTFSSLSVATLLASYSAIVVPSDHGGTLTEQDLAALDGRSADILAYLNGAAGCSPWPKTAITVAAAARSCSASCRSWCRLPHSRKPKTAIP